MGFTTTVFTEVSDNHTASVAKRLLQTDISFDSVPCRCKPWSVSPSAKQRSICLRWGHLSYHCSSKSAWCTVCAGNHKSTMHLLLHMPMPNTISSSAQIALRNIGLLPKPAPSIRLVSTQRGWLCSNNNDSTGLEKPTAQDHVFPGTCISMMKNCLNTDSMTTMEDSISPPPLLFPHDSYAAQTA